VERLLLLAQRFVDQADVVERPSFPTAITDSSPEQKRLFIFLHRQSQRLRRPLRSQLFSLLNLSFRCSLILSLRCGWWVLPSGLSVVAARLRGVYDLAQRQAHGQHPTDIAADIEREVLAKSYACHRFSPQWLICKTLFNDAPSSLLPPIPRPRLSSAKVTWRF